jgi:hypothetical protein
MQQQLMLQLAHWHGAPSQHYAVLLQAMRANGRAGIALPEARLSTGNGNARFETLNRRGDVVVAIRCTNTQAMPLVEQLAAAAAAATKKRRQ